MAIKDIALAAAIAASNPSEQGPKKPENPVDTRTAIVQEAVQKAMTTDLTAMKLEWLLEEVKMKDPIVSVLSQEPILLAWAEWVSGVVDFSKFEALWAYKAFPEVDKTKVKQMYDMLVKEAWDNAEKQKWVKFVIWNFIMFLKSISYNPESTIGKSEQFLDKTIDALSKSWFWKEFAAWFESSRGKAQERDKYTMELASLSPEELQSRMDKMRKEIEEMRKETSEMKKENDERKKRIEAKRQILENLRQVYEAMNKKVS